MKKLVVKFVGFSVVLYIFIPNPLSKWEKVENVKAKENPDVVEAAPPVLVSKPNLPKEVQAEVDAFVLETEDAKEKERVLEVRTTAYTHTESDHVKYGCKTAAGTTLKHGNVTSAAADWSFLPLGTKFQIVGSEIVYLVEDYGGALVGTEVIDIYTPTRSAMNKWGRRDVQIKILEKGSTSDSIEILRGRLKYQHCREMYHSLIALSEEE